ncbi:HEAT repeat domain-containing protein [Maribacter chungangensis]|uniref:HEAT repeat domain-containing protein n=1 Tax=Maribacter chungangensis TaxID=1069117 RepID=A0ABW3B375_9FLAO
MNFYLNTYTNNVLISAPKIPTEFLWALSLFFVVVALIYFGSVFFFRNRLSRLGKQVIAKRKVFSPMICEFLFFEEDGEKKEKINYIDLKIQIRELIKNSFDRAVLIEVLMDLKKDVTGKTRTDLLHIYQDLELHKDAYKKLNSWRWELISKGIHELTQMEVKDSYGLITRFINDKRTTIRKQAEIATVSLKEEGINYFLDHTKYKISEWQQLKLLDVVRNKTDYEPPAFRLWLTSKNNDVVLFSLRLIKYYNQNDASASLIQLLRHKSDAIKKEAIFCIRDFNVTDAVPVLKTIFWKCTTDVKMYLLEALSQLGTEEDIGFLEDLITKEVAFTVKGKAISALNTIRPEGVLPTQDIVPKEDFEPLEPTASSLAISSDENVVLSDKKGEEMNEKDISVSKDSLNFDAEGLSKPSLEILPAEISFLPIVTADAPNEVLEPLEDIVKNEKVETNVKDLKVYVETVLPPSPIDQLHYEFLPIVTAETVHDEKQTCNDLPVCFEEVKSAYTSKTEQDKSAEPITNEIWVWYEELTVSKKSEAKTEEIENDSKTELSKSNQEPKIGFSDNIARAEVSQITVIYDVLEHAKASTSKDEIPEIDWCRAFDMQKPTDQQEDSIEINIENDMEKELGNIPKPLFYDDAALNTAALLEDIAELGDHREIPHLKMLLDKESNAALRGRIKELIASFSISDEIQITFEPTLVQERQSVFQSLFEVSDTEAKIILLDEIADIGDEQEIPLLESLILNEDKQLQKAAKRALDAISVRLTSIAVPDNFEERKKAKEKTVTDESDMDSLFIVDFDFISPAKTGVKEKDAPTNQMDGNTMFDHLCAMSTKLYQKK